MIILCLTVLTYLLVLLARVAMGWIEVPAAGGMASFARGIHAATEPPLAVLRAVVPPLRVGPAAVDPSPFLLALALLLLAAIVC